MRARDKTRLALKKMSRGFTIVELLLVIVVIGIIAAIVIAAYKGMQDRAYDASVQSDLSNIAKKIKMYHAENGVVPSGSIQLATIKFKINKTAFGSPYDNGTSTYNILYCRVPTTNPNDFALVAYSRTGNGFQYSSGGQLSAYTGPKTGSTAMCGSAGITITGSERDWFYDSGTWQSTFVLG